MSMSFSGRLELSDIDYIIRKRGLNNRGSVQYLIDSEVIRLSDPYVPFLSGTLKASAKAHTFIGSGDVRYIAEDPKYHVPYSRINYYRNAGNGIEGTAHGGKRGKLWFERMKIDHKDEILRAAAKKAGGFV